MYLVKALTIFVTGLFVGLFMCLFQSDNWLSYVPLLSLIRSGNFYISAYDFFFAFFAGIILGMYRLHGIHPKSVLVDIKSWLRVQAWELAIMAGVGIASYLYVNPFLFQLFDAPIDALSQAPDAIRRSVMASLPFWWMFIVGLINKAKFSQQTVPSSQGIHMPPPPHYTP